MRAEALGLHIKSPRRVKKTTTHHFLKPYQHAHKLHTKEVASINLNAFNTKVRSKTNSEATICPFFVHLTVKCLKED